MTNNEKRAAELSIKCLGKTNSQLHDLVLEALNAAHAEGYREGAEKMRELAKAAREYLEATEDYISDTAFDANGGLAAANAELYVLAHSAITPPQPAAQDDEREMRAAFERDINNDDGNKPPLCEYSYKAGWQAAWKEKSK